MVTYRKYNKSKSLNEKRSLIPSGFRVPYFLHAFLQISSLCKGVYIGETNVRASVALQALGFYVINNIDNKVIAA